MDKKISELTNTAALQDTDEMALARSGQTLKITASNAGKRFGVRIQTTQLAYTPAATGNPDINTVAQGADGFWYLIDREGKAIKILDLLTGQVIVEDKHFTHSQTTAAAVWTVTHNLNKYPSVEVEIGGSLASIYSVENVNVNQLIIRLDVSTTGKVFCN